MFIKKRLRKLSMEQYIGIMVDHEKSEYLKVKYEEIAYKINSLAYSTFNLQNILNERNQCCL